jgi:hypothetical protein
MLADERLFQHMQRVIALILPVPPVPGKEARLESQN